MLAPQDSKLLARLALLALSFVLETWLIVNHYFLFASFLSLVIVYEFWLFYKFQHGVYKEVEQFREAIKYKDISRRFDLKGASAELAPLREAFNAITDSFKQATKETETQYQYLQHILSIVNTGILSFKRQTGEVVWMNRAVKDMLNLPHLKNIAALQKRNAVLSDAVNNIEVGGSKLLTLQAANTPSRILLSVTGFQVEAEYYKLITFQNVSEAIEETEADAWSRLLRVMTHEIMNSIAPISSLASTMTALVNDSVKRNEPQPSYIEDLKAGINTIGKRSEALLKFAETYRNLSKISSLNLEPVYVRDLFESLSILMAPTLAERKIELEIVLKDPSIKVAADRNLLEQVLINLLVNAIEAVKDSENPRILLMAERDIQKKCIIHVVDNGHGIPDELLDKIFVPFFSTRKNGSGIGLNLCKQIMALHKGSLSVKTIKESGTDFILSFS